MWVKMSQPRKKQKRKTKSLDEMIGEKTSQHGEE